MVPINYQDELNERVKSLINKSQEFKTDAEQKYDREK